MKLKILAAAALLGIAGVAQAATCSAYVNGATPALLNTSNVTLNGAEANGCYGHVVQAQNNSLETVTQFVNDAQPFGTGTWTGLLRAEAGLTANVYDGLRFSIVGLDLADADQFILKIEDLDPGAPPSLPLTMDLILSLKASTLTDFYFFNDIQLTASNDGTYQMAIANRNGNLRDLSDISLLGRDIRSQQCLPGDPTCTPNQIPEPTTLLLASAALLGAGFARRRRS